MMIKNLLVKNLGLRIVALILAIIVWAMISGKERSYSEKTIDVKVEYFNVGSNIDIRSVNPDKVQVKFLATSKQLSRINSDSFKLQINLKNVTESGRIFKFSEDLLVFPQGVEIISIYPKLIEITAAEFITREVPVRIRYKGKLKPGINLIDRRIVPEKVSIFGYKSQINAIQTIDGIDSINLADIDESQVIRIRLKKSKEILKFHDNDTVEVHITVENKNKKEQENKQNTDDHTNSSAKTTNHSN